MELHGLIPCELVNEIAIRRKRRLDLIQKAGRIKRGFRLEPAYNPGRALSRNDFFIGWSLPILHDSFAGRGVCDVFSYKPVILFLRLA